MDTIRVAHYEPIGDDQVTDGAILEVTNELPKMRDITNSLHFYDDEAVKVMEVLEKLPQGTIHQLVILLLEKYAVLYRGAPKVWS